MRLSIGIFLLTLLVGCSGPSVEKNSEEAPLSIRWELVSNLVDDAEVYKNRLHVTNKSDGPLDANWVMYFNQLPRKIFSQESGDQLLLESVNGDFFSVKPGKAYKSLGAGESLSIEFDCEYWAIKESDAPVGYYFVHLNADGVEGSPMVITETSVAPLNEPKHYTRTKSDKFPFPGADFLYNKAMEVDQDIVLKDFDILPAPKSVSYSEGMLDLSSGLSINAENTFANEASLLKTYLKEETNFKLSDSGIEIILKQSGKLNGEAYRIEVNKSGIQIVAGAPSGAHNAIQTLRVVLATLDADKLQFASVMDEPDLSYRGQFIDVGRNFQSKEQIMKMLDLFAAYKLNKFHFHITDDEGWRLEIPGIPELTEVGAKRGHTLDESDRLYPAYGSGPFSEANSAGSGYYSRPDFIEILQYAAVRHIEVIPEIDLPGHARAAIVSMKARYKKYAEQGDMVKAEEYLLHDPNDKSEYSSVQGYTDNTVCIGRESVYHFWDKVVGEVKEMYSDAGLAFNVLHTGGDEVPHGAWSASPMCEELIDRDERVSSPADYPNYFLTRTEEILKKHGVAVAGWQEVGLIHEKDPNPVFKEAGFRTYCWNTVPDWGGDQIPYQLANFGYPVVLCNGPNFYFDMAYDKDPREPGYYWAAFVDEQASYNMLPYKVYNSIPLGRNGEVSTWAEAAKGKTPLTAAGRKNIMGVQGEVWSETVRDGATLEYYLFPKMMGLVERAWNASPAWADIEQEESREVAYRQDFSNYLTVIGTKELRRLAKIKGGVNYRVPAPGVKVEDKKIKAMVYLPGAEIRYTIDGSEPTAQSSLYDSALDAKQGTYRFKAFVAGKGGNDTAISL